MTFCMPALRRQASAWLSLPPDRRLLETRAWLLNHGALEERRGVYASVHALPDQRDQVLKVFSLAPASGRATWAYLKGVSIYDNPLFPAVHRMARVQDVALVWMERLSERREGEVALLVSEALSRYFQDETQLQRALSPDDFPGGSWHQGQVSFEQLVGASELLTDIIDDLPECDADIHEENFMVRYRPDGSPQLVLTDPLA